MKKNNSSPFYRKIRYKFYNMHLKKLKSEQKKKAKNEKKELIYHPKLEFIYNVIVIDPKKDIIITNKSIIFEELYDLIKNLKDIEINEIKSYNKVQNIICKILINELSLIKKLLDSLKKEENLSFLLNIMNKKIRQIHNKGKPIIDNVNGSDQSINEELQNQFHEILNSIHIKINEKNKYSIITQYSLLESLLWKIKCR